MPPVQNIQYQQQQPSNFDKFKMGLMMGYILGSAATFGLFMSIGSVIRSESAYDVAMSRPGSLAELKAHMMARHLVSMEQNKNNSQ
ncbi:hypothetical protein KL930_000661 [Ogataea haglerorum]|uniref:uncharacterized protein n=1 Tax=Ogataea haglerorum TaxID=1937702 RepID=UPI001C89BA71|nr:uncharacterized protein KL911_003344 [Ogataea haglerorum]KAG7699974.1 hypothetical protein KL915_000663 [Ogataea haglerorum]KAG7711446.1 hypothetical protein KL914_000088 [Ogataea haglerorum]KAG7712217.1 hypothetical protein KL950_000088 [Ogataea haglerorum]KAG7734522.1 hypothetical protein KL948_000088 [Ogataea haglerorum]KAG7752613.1 hypothetical protein KL911_003344 [Ogataea haglerorum]